MRLDDHLGRALWWRDGASRGTHAAQRIRGVGPGGIGFGGAHGEVVVLLVSEAGNGKLALGLFGQIVNIIFVVVKVFLGEEGLW